MFKSIKYHGLIYLAGSDDKWVKQKGRIVNPPHWKDRKKLLLDWAKKQPSFLWNDNNGCIFSEDPAPDKHGSSGVTLDGETFVPYKDFIYLTLDDTETIWTMAFNHYDAHKAVARNYQEYRIRQIQKEKADKEKKEASMAKSKIKYKGAVYVEAADGKSWIEGKWHAYSADPGMDGNPTFTASTKKKTYVLVLSEADKKVGLQVTNDKGEDLEHEERKVGTWVKSAVKGAMATLCLAYGLPKSPSLDKLWAMFPDWGV